MKEGVCAIWADELNISHMRVIELLFIDSTWYKSNEFSHILIIEYKDLIIKEKIVSAYVFMNSKK